MLAFGVGTHPLLISRGPLKPRSKGPTGCCADPCRRVLTSQPACILVNRWPESADTREGRAVPTMAVGESGATGARVKPDEAAQPRKRTADRYPQEIGVVLAHESAHCRG